MTSLTVTPLAEADIEAIWDFSAKQWGIDQADSYVAAIRALISRIVENPLQGRRSDELLLGSRRISSGSHVIFYETSVENVEVVRILHVTMDYARHL